MFNMLLLFLSRMLLYLDVPGESVTYSAVKSGFVAPSVPYAGKRPQ